MQKVTLTMGLALLLTWAVSPTQAGLVGHWKLDEAGNPSGSTTAFDSSGNALNGTYQPLAGPGPVREEIGARPWTATSADFDGGADEIYLAKPAVLNNLVKDFTVMAWIHPDDVVGTERVFARNPTEGWGFGCNGAKIRLTTWGRKDFDTTDVLTAGKWQHICATFKENGASSYTVAFYLNGTMAGTVDHTQPASSGSTKNWFIGSHGTGERFAGRLDDVRVYDHVMTQAEVVEVVFNGTTPFTHRLASPVFKYSFPQSFDGTSTKITDLTVLTHDGTMDNASGYSATMKPAGAPGGSITGSAGGHGRTDAIDLLNNTAVEGMGGFKIQTWFYWPGNYSNIRKLLDYAGTDYLATLNSKIRFVLSNGGTILEADIVEDTWYFVEAYFDTDGNSAEADPNYPGDFRINGHAYLYLDGQLVGSAPNATKSGFGDSLNRPVGINRWAGGGGDWNQGYIYDPVVYLGVGQVPTVGTLFIIR